MKLNGAIAIDLGTIERRHHGRLVAEPRAVELTGGVVVEQGTGLRDVAVRSIDRLARVYSRIDRDHLSAAYRLYEDFGTAGCEPQLCARYEHVDAASGEMTDDQAEAHQRLKEALRAVRLSTIRELVFSVVLMDEETNRIRPLCTGLYQIGVHYGIVK